MRSVVSLLVVALIAVLAYKFWFSQMQSTGTGTPTQTITVVGVKNDLLAIAQAERAYQAEHGSYASLDELNSSGALTISKTGRDGYVYEAQTSGTGFRIVAHCPAATSPGCEDWSVDETMEVSPMH
ncbi:MAG TPA: hypothetical protein VMJ93_13840 [Verrucomicrobiae bacterium]|nr:hypothetical protein [Verrucomicrobiae bacterium]